MTEPYLREYLLPFPEKDDRKIWVYVPPHNSGDKLPVMYMTDGQNLFDEKSTPFGSWDVKKAVEDELKSSGVSCVIVGIDNGNVYRDSELTPKCIGEIQCREEFNDIFTPQGEIFDDFLVNTVMPFVEQNFPVSNQRAKTAVCGSSSGGLQAFFAGMEHSDKFSFVGALSPAFIVYSEEDLRSYLLSKVTDDMPYIYMYSGGADELEQRIFASVEMMYDLLPEVGYPYDKFNEVLLFENEHNEKAWREIFPDVLRTFIDSTKAI